MGSRPSFVVRYIAKAALSAALALVLTGCQPSNLVMEATHTVSKLERSEVSIPKAKSLFETRTTDTVKTTKE